MSLLNDLVSLFTGQHSQPQGQTSAPQSNYHSVPVPSQQTGLSGSLQSSSLPNALANPIQQSPQQLLSTQLAQMGNQYTANPTSPQFLGVDPAQFGYPADNTVRPGIPQSPQLPFTQNTQR